MSDTITLNKECYDFMNKVLKFKPKCKFCKAKITKESGEDE